MVDVGDRCGVVTPNTEGPANDMREKLAKGVEYGVQLQDIDVEARGVEVPYPGNLVGEGTLPTPNFQVREWRNVDTHNAVVTILRFDSTKLFGEDGSKIQYLSFSVALKTSLPLRLVDKPSSCSKVHSVFQDSCVIHVLQKLSLAVPFLEFEMYTT